MASRSIPFVNGEFYHIFNRGVAKMPIFYSSYDYIRFTKTMFYYQIAGTKPRFSVFSPTTTTLDNSHKVVNIVCYCLMPNHFHFLLEQIVENGITEFMSKLSNSYTKYINTKNNRVGPLFQGEFRAVHVESDEQFIHLSRYIHLNPLVSYVTKNLDAYRWSSYPEYVGISDTTRLTNNREIILNQFSSRGEYKQFVLNQEDYGKKLELIKHQLIDFYN